MQTTFLRNESYVPNSFNSLENRQILLNIMRDIGLFDDINETYITFIKNDLDDKVNHIFQTKNSTDTTVKMNKRVITEMMTEINKYKNNAIKADLSNKAEPSNKADLSNKAEPSYKAEPSNKAEPSYKEENLITSADIKNHKLETFQKDVSKTREDFNKFNKKKNPEHIEFTIDVNTKPDPAQMTDLYNKAILLRNQDLNLDIPVDNKVKGSKWINRDLTDSFEIESLQNRNIKISKDDARVEVIKLSEAKLSEAKLSEAKLSEPKRVTFSNDSDAFLLKMKEKYVKNEQPVLAQSVYAPQVYAEPVYAPITEQAEPVYAEQVYAKPVLAEQVYAPQADPRFEEYIKNQLQLLIENQNKILSFLKN